MSISVARVVSSLETKMSLFIVSSVLSSCSSDDRNSLKYFTLVNSQSWLEDFSSEAMISLECRDNSSFSLYTFELDSKI